MKLNEAAIVDRLNQRLPRLLAVYALAAAGRISPDLAGRLKKMVGFRNIAVHDDQALLLPVVTAIITRHLDDFTEFTGTLASSEP
ncbi:MAG: DUF86 domain-containing protein [Methylocystis sp.]|uniref:DUF86 domain-containing protein n=1 Tax=Methylocystis sp. TaxID=1911079 RepID=UPI003DA25D9C